MMRKRDYMVSTNSFDEIFSTLKEARNHAKKYSKEYGESWIQKWTLINGDMVIDDNFTILYEDGVITKEIK